MAWDETRKAALLAYCRIDEPTAEDEALLQTLYLGAVSYMAQAGVSEPAAELPERAAQYDICVNAMVLDGWDSRRATVTGSVFENPAFRRMLNQMKLTEPVSDSDTAE